MTTITREQLIAKLQNRIAVTANYPGVEEAQLDAAIFKIALASLEAKPVAYMSRQNAKLREKFGTCDEWDVHHQSVGAGFPLIEIPESDDYEIMPLYAAPPVLERERIRREHAEWSDATFGDVGPIGPLKHLSKEALEAAAEPDDLSEWADMQFLLWDAQRRAGISDEQITQAMVEKLAVNKQREWPVPRDGEPRLHIKDMPAPVMPEECPAELPYAQVKAAADLYALCWQSGEVVTYTPDPEKATIWLNNYSGTCVQEYAKLERLQEALAGNSPVTPDGYALVPVEPTDEMIAAAMNCEDVLFNSDESFCVRFGNIYEAMLAAAPKPQNAPQNIPENIPAGKSTLTPDGWISCSERMPEDEQEVIVQNKFGYRYVSYFDEHSGLFFDMPGGNQMNCIEHILVTHWRPMPVPPQQ